MRAGRRWALWGAGGAFVVLGVAMSVAQGRAARYGSTAQIERLRAGCQVAAGAAFYPSSSPAIVASCRELVRARLRAPTSAAFVPLDRDHPAMVNDDGCTLTYESTVDAQNAFGAPLRATFRCTYDPRAGDAEVRFPDGEAE